MAAGRRMPKTDAEEKFFVNYYFFKKRRRKPGQPQKNVLQR
jgi:hypothetical protein